MKYRAILIAALTFPTVSSAGIIGWLTSQTRDWQFVQDRGGIRISAPIEKEGKKVLPVDFIDKVDSGLSVRRIALEKRGSQLVIRVVTQLADKDSKFSPTYFIDLASIRAGSYDVFYETAGDPTKRLGRIEIK